MISIRTVLSELINLELRTLIFGNIKDKWTCRKLCTSHDSFFYNKYSNSWGPTQRKNDIPSAQDNKSFVKQMVGVHGFVVLYFVAVLYSVYSIDPLLMHLSYVFLASTHRHDVIKWRHFPRYHWLLALCEGNSAVTDYSHHKDQWRGALMFSLIFDVFLAPKQRVEQKIETPVIWDAIALIMTLL